jgi:acetylornithine/N-succinyldiaminopimelate aminotransferase
MGRCIWYPGHDVLLEDVVRGEGCYLYDSNGKRYVDLESGVWCTSLGHGHPRILKTLREQAARIAHNGFIYASPIVEEAASEILDLLGFSGGNLVFICSGSEAVEYGVRVTRMTTDRPLLMTMADSYFGAYGSAWRRDEAEWFSFDWLACSDCPDERVCDETCPRWAAVPFGKIGGFLFEPGSSSGLVRFPPVKLIRGIVDMMRRERGIVQVNEVTTGIARTGKWFGYQHYGITPDIVSMGKGIGNGYPVSVTAFRPGVIERLAGKPIPYAQSHQNDPLGAAVAREVIRVIEEEGLVQRAVEIGGMLVAGLEEIKARTGRIREIRSRGLLVAIEMEDGPDEALTRKTLKHLLDRGYVVARRSGFGVLRVDPPLTIDADDIQGFIEALDSLLGRPLDGRY